MSHVNQNGMTELFIIASKESMFKLLKALDLTKMINGHMNIFYSLYIKCLNQSLFSFGLSLILSYFDKICFSVEQCISGIILFMLFSKINSLDKTFDLLVRAVKQITTTLKEKLQGQLIYKFLILQTIENYKYRVNACFGR